MIHIPAVLSFLGYIPWEEPEDPFGRLAHFKKIKGLSFERLGALVGRDPEQLMDWLSGRKRPCNRNVKNLLDFLSDIK